MSKQLNWAKIGNIVITAGGITFFVCIAIIMMIAAMGTAEELTNSAHTIPDYVSRAIVTSVMWPMFATLPCFLLCGIGFEFSESAPAAQHA